MPSVQLRKRSGDLGAYRRLWRARHNRGGVHVLQVYHIPTLMTLLLMPAALAGSCCASWYQAYSMHVIV